MKLMFLGLLIAMFILVGCGGKTAGNTTNSPTSSSNNSSPAKLDACALLTKSDAESLLGGPVTLPRTSQIDSGATAVSQCRYNNASGEKQVGLLARRAPTAAVAKQIFEEARDASKGLSGVDPEAVSGFGEEAYWTGGRLNQLNVLKDDTWLIITSHQGKGDSLPPTKDAANSILAHMK